MISDIHEIYSGQIMCSLPQIIKLKCLTAQLTDKEFDGLFTELREEFGREYVMQLLCASMMPTSPQVDNRNSIESITRTVAKIIEERDPSSQNSDESDKKCITDLPRALVGEIASYLKRKSYSRLAETNRKIFVDCHFPNRLTRLDVPKLTDYSRIPLQNYSQLRQLGFRLPYFITFNTPSIATHCPQLKTLVICLNDTTDDISGPAALEVYLDLFFAENSGGFRNVTNLVITNRKPEKSDLIIKLLEVFPALTYLKCVNIGFSTITVAQEVATVCPSIRKLFCRGMAYDVFAVGGLKTTLETLSWSSRYSVVPELPCGDWSNLRRLCLRAPARKVMKQFLVNAKKLKQICFVPNVGQTRRQPMTDEEIGMIAKQLFTDYSSLEFIYISTRGHFERICDSIHSGLYRTRELKREFLEIALHLDCSEISDLEDFMCNISKILMVISGSRIKQWMLTLEQHQKYSFKQIAKVLRKFIRSYLVSGFDIKILHRSSATLIVGNSRCTALSHRRWWNDGIKAVLL